MFDGRVPEVNEQNKNVDNSEASSDDDDTESMPLSERLRTAKVVEKNPCNLKKLMNYTKDFFVTQFSYEDEADETTSRWSWSDEYEDFDTYPRMTSVLLDKQESFFAKFMLSAEGNFEKNPSIAPKITTASSTSNTLRPKRRARKQLQRIKTYDSPLSPKPFTSEMIQCLICGLSFLTAKHCRRHAQIHYTENYYPCCLCDETFTTEQHCDEHYLEHTDDKGRKFGTKKIARLNCNECGKKFSNKARLQFHKGYHDPIAVPCHCIKCDRKFSSEASLYGHVLSVHIMQGEFFCHLCGQEFR